MDPPRGHLGHAAKLGLEPSFWTTNFVDPVTSLSSARQWFVAVGVVAFVLVNVAFYRLASILSRPPIQRRPAASAEHPTHVLVVLGSGGHTAEMFNILSQVPCLQLDFTYRTYVVSSGDGFSARKAREFEELLLADLESTEIAVPKGTLSNYDIVTVHRARRVHQSLLTAPWSSLKCLWDCFSVLRGTHRDFQAGRRARGNMYPDLILTNGPATGVIVVLASIISLFLGYRGPSPAKPSSKQPPHPQSGQMRSIYIESWARVKKLSLSGRLLKPFVDRFIVQWPQLVEAAGNRVEYIGPLVT